MSLVSTQMCMLAMWKASILLVCVLLLVGLLGSAAAAVSWSSFWPAASWDGQPKMTKTAYDIDDIVEIKTMPVKIDLQQEQLLVCPGGPVGGQLLLGGEVR